jgi:two-component system, OmpR family, sensor histidine kinase SenX3
VTSVLAVAVVGAGVAIVWLAVRWRTAVAECDDLRRAGTAAADECRQAKSRAEQVEAALDAVANGVVVFDVAGEAAYRNPPAASYLAARHGDALVEEAITTLAEEALAGDAAERDVEVYGPPRRTLSLRAVPLGEALAPAGALVEVEDTSERRRLENVRRDFVANISHELKTPVGALVLLAETLHGEEDGEVVRRLAERMASEAYRVGHTIDDLLELSTLEASPTGVSKELVPVGLFVAEAVDRVRSGAERLGIVVDVDEPSEDLDVQGERRQLVSALHNLLDNAVKYSDPGSRVEVRASLVSDRRGDWVDVEVRDHGIGIPRRDLERIFERFYRVDRARSRETGGTGLGLAIVRHVVHNHQGEVRVRSREGEGSTFTLRLPTEKHDKTDKKEPELR